MQKRYLYSLFQVSLQYNGSDFVYSACIDGCLHPSTQPFANCRRLFPSEMYVPFVEAINMVVLHINKIFVFHIQLVIKIDVRFQLKMVLEVLYGKSKNAPILTSPKFCFMPVVLKFVFASVSGLL